MNFTIFSTTKIFASLCALSVALVAAMPTSAAKLAKGKPITFISKQEIAYTVADNAPQVVHTAIGIFEKDLASVLSAMLVRTTDKAKANVVVRTLKPAEPHDPIAGKHEAFRIAVEEGRLCVTGSDANGTAYGLMELSRMLGVSPWEWWADSYSAPLATWVIPANTLVEQSPAVQYRGIFINAEDWGMCPWSWQTHEPSEVKGRIGPKTHERIFELLLRLRANTFWPAMHECSVPFFMVDGNREAADKYGITIGSSHCEPMLCNVNGEWKKTGVGAYNYFENRDNVLQFWESRVKEMAHSNSYFTLGMRGVHDSRMEGAKGIDDQREALAKILKDQRAMIKKHVNDDVTKVPQVFIPYKEVLEVYRSGLSVPDDVTLMWCDDNHGYIRHHPSKQEQARSGGNGVYYHISYWGVPHDYLWLASTSPALIRTELERAFDSNVRQIWIFNVGDIKPAEYLMEYCLDMAWNKDILRNRSYTTHLNKWLEREFGKELAQKLVPLWKEYYSLSYRCRPEFLGNTRDDRASKVKDLPWSDEEVQSRLQHCQRLELDVHALSKDVAPEKEAQWYQLVEYPLLSCFAMNRKMLGAQLMRHGKAPWIEAVQAYDDIVGMTQVYNSMLGGKWRHMMSYKPRNLPVFEPVDTTQISMDTSNTPKMSYIRPSQGKFGAASYMIPELGYSREALSLAKNDVFTATLPSSTDTLRLTLAFVPNHPAEAAKLQVCIQVGNGLWDTIAYQTSLSGSGRGSEEWAVNVLRNQARRVVRVSPSPAARPIRIRALTSAVVLDWIGVAN
jgi:hypothetical protein